LDDGQGARASIRNKMWGDHGMLSRGDPRFMVGSGSRDRSSTF
jgi:hypothetical protein